MDQIPLQLDKDGIKEREDGEKEGGGGALFEGSDYFKYFHQKGGDYSTDGNYSRKYASHASQLTTNHYQPSGNRLQTRTFRGILRKETAVNFLKGKEFKAILPDFMKLKKFSCLCFEPFQVDRV